MLFNYNKRNTETVCAEISTNRETNVSNKAWIRRFAFLLVLKDGKRNIEITLGNNYIICEGSFNEILKMLVRGGNGCVVDALLCPLSRK